LPRRAGPALPAPAPRARTPSLTRLPLSSHPPPPPPLQIDDALEYTDETLNALSLDTGVSGASILVAEDNPFNLEVVRTFIEMAHMKCTWAPNGQRVLDIYKENVAAFDLILMDCQMPILDGYCATRAIREFEVAESLERIPIVGLTAFAMSGDREKCIDAGMDDYLTKPIGKAALIRTIAAHKRASAPVTAENAGRRLDESESIKEQRALGDDLETSMIDATLVTRDATMMAAGLFCGADALRRKKKKESMEERLLTKDGDSTPIPEIVKPVVE